MSKGVDKKTELTNKTNKIPEKSKKAMPHNCMSFQEECIFSHVAGKETKGKVFSS